MLLNHINYHYYIQLGRMIDLHRKLFVDHFLDLDLIVIHYCNRTSLHQLKILFDYQLYIDYMRWHKLEQV